MRQVLLLCAALLFLLVLASFSSVACSGAQGPEATTGAPRPVPTEPPPSNGLTEADVRGIRAQCPAGVPVDDQAAERGQVHFIVRDGYALEHSSREKIPLWVCEHLTARDVHGGQAHRKNHFLPDPALPVGERAEIVDYQHSGYDRGHQAAAGDRADQRLMDETFFLSNMCPQANELNRGVWREIEEQVRAWIEARGDGRVVTGPILAGSIAHIGPGQVAVPSHFFKIVAAPGASRRTEAIAFIAENRGDLPSNVVATYVRSVDEIERMTGFDFMPELSPDDEARLERRPSAMW